MDSAERDANIPLFWDDLGYVTLSPRIFVFELSFKFSCSSSIPYCNLRTTAVTDWDNKHIVVTFRRHKLSGQVLFSREMQNAPLAAAVQVRPAKTAAIRIAGQPPSHTTGAFCCDFIFIAPTKRFSLPCSQKSQWRRITQFGQFPRIWLVNPEPLDQQAVSHINFLYPGSTYSLPDSLNSLITPWEQQSFLDCWNIVPANVYGFI